MKKRFGYRVINTTTVMADQDAGVLARKDCVDCVARSRCDHRSPARRTNTMMFRAAPRRTRNAWVTLACTAWHLHHLGVFVSLPNSCSHPAAGEVLPGTIGGLAGGCARDVKREPRLLQRHCSCVDTTFKRSRVSLTPMMQS